MLGLSPLHLAIMSVVPYYDSLRSYPKPQLIPEPLLSITRVQFCVWHFFLEVLWRQAGNSALRGRNFRPSGRNFRSK